MTDIANVSDEEPFSATILAVVGLKREARLVTGSSVLAVAGGGDAETLRGRLMRLAASRPVRAVVSVGIGGALWPELRVGDWVVAERVVYGVESWVSDSAYVAALKEALADVARPLILPTPPRGAGPFPLPQGERGRGASSPIPLREKREGPAAARRANEGSRRAIRVLTGTIVGSDVMIVDAAAKVALYTATGALAVDMESHVAARFATEHALPFIALRVISDGADRALPKAAQAGMKKDGGMDILAVLLELAKDPRQLPALIRTGREAEVAFRQLKLLNRHDLLGRLGVGDLDLG